MSMNKAKTQQKIDNLQRSIEFAEETYARVLEQCVGFGHFQNIKTWANEEKLSLHQAAQEYLLGEKADLAERRRK